MQVCRNGHVVTDLLRSCPQHGLGHCDRCGAETIDRCPTCGQALAGSVPVPGQVPVGRPRPPEYCGACGASFPWTASTPPAETGDALQALESLLRRVPRTVRQLRVRHADRPPFRVVDEFDLQDLVRSLLPLVTERVIPESRVPSYAAVTRSDFWVGPAAGETETVVAVKRTATPADERALAEELREDVGYYAARPKCRVLVALVYDPEGLLREPTKLETAWSKLHDTLELRCVIAS
jgi:hypothetical protein